MYANLSGARRKHTFNPLLVLKSLIPVEYFQRQEEHRKSAAANTTEFAFIFTGDYLRDF